MWCPIHSLLNEAQPFGDKTKSKDQERLNRAGLLDDLDKVGDTRLMTCCVVFLYVYFSVNFFIYLCIHSLI